MKSGPVQPIEQSVSEIYKKHYKHHIINDAVSWGKMNVQNSNLVHQIKAYLQSNHKNLKIIGPAYLSSQQNEIIIFVNS